MPIEFDLEACTTIINVTRLKPISTAAPSELAAALNQATANMLQRFECAPVSNRQAAGEATHTLQSAIERMRWRIGFPQSNRHMGAIPPQWAAEIRKFSKRPGGPTSAEVNKNMRQLANLLVWMREQAKAQEKSYNHGAPDDRKAAVTAFCHDMLMAYEALFGRHPGVSQGKDGAGPLGPAVRFLPAVLEQLRKKLAESGLHDAANDGALRLTPHMIADAYAPILDKFQLFKRNKHRRIIPPSRGYIVRHAISTTAPLRAPEHPGLAAPLLGISKEVVEAHYNRSQQVSAVRTFQSIVEKLGRPNSSD